ncbi:hypothetical protein [Mesorhizobium sp. CN2-181]|uniref:hypothetical protein n=1 Tax=Mesorhizobium yinganensis TaxID=3157707 RepID=UPI0032B7A46E
MASKERASYIWAGYNLLACSMHRLKKPLVGVLLLAGVIFLIYAMDRSHDRGVAVTATYPTGEIVSALSDHGTRFIVKLDHSAETIMVHDSVLLPLPAGTKVPLERLEFTDGTIKYQIVRRR